MNIKMMREFVNENNELHRLVNFVWWLSPFSILPTKPNEQHKNIIN